MDLVDNAPLRTAVAAFAAKPDQATYLEVVRNCLQGNLLFDSTGSSITMTEDGSSIAAGSTFHFREGKGPNGERAIFAFTRQEEAQRMHPDEPATTMGQPAGGVFEFAKSQGYGWVYIDPAGPTCGVGIPDVDFVLRNARNDAVKNAIGAGKPSDVLDALALGAPLMYAVIEHPDKSVEVRTSVSPDGKPVRLAFTSAAEVAARSTTDAFATIDLARIVSDALEAPFEGLVINPAGPWTVLGPEQLRILQGRLPAPG